MLGSYYVAGRYQGERLPRALVAAQRLADATGETVDVCQAVRQLDGVAVEPVQQVHPALKAWPGLA
jgi:phage-related minor tail protein